MDRQAMLEFMPHRGRNVLIDDYEDTGEMSGRGRLTVEPGDPLGRDMFLVHSDGAHRYSPFFLVEHAALTSILLLRSEMGGGRLAYFSVISSFVSHGEARAGTPLVSHLERGRDRREFRSFHSRIETEAGSPVAEVSFMAYLAARGERPVGGSPRPGAVSFPAPEPDRFPCLDPALAFLGTADGGEVGGVYPADHPLAEGHFPGAPVMMGMTQWLAVAQRAALDAPAGTSVVEGSGALTLADGGPVAEVTGMRLKVVKGDDGRVTDLRLLETKRVAFRNRVLPGDAYLAAWRPD